MRGGCAISENWNRITPVNYTVLRRVQARCAKSQNEKVHVDEGLPDDFVRWQPAGPAKDAGGAHAAFVDGSAAVPERRVGRDFQFRPAGSHPSAVV